MPIARADIPTTQSVSITFASRRMLNLRRRPSPRLPLCQCPAQLCPHRKWNQSPILLRHLHQPPRQLSRLPPAPHSNRTSAAPVMPIARVDIPTTPSVYTTSASRRMPSQRSRALHRRNPRLASSSQFLEQPRITTPAALAMLTAAKAVIAITACAKRKRLSNLRLLFPHHALLRHQLQLSQRREQLKTIMSAAPAMRTVERDTIAITESARKRLLFNLLNQLQRTARQRHLHQ
jgi:hypothetical protein